ncbi:MAG: polymer-forming cytoskeletal protein [Lachnospiraceae bacterium]|nr:polymer-forming cytoskeletal protein [Lachnospiraceae bacterium]
MGFFSDLKDDLSQAVNELMPEEELEAALAAEGQAGEQASADAAAPETPSTDETLESLDLSGMLDKIEELGMPEPQAVPEAEDALVGEPLEEEVLEPEPIIEEAAAEEPMAAEEEPAVEEAVIEEEEAEPVMEEEILTEAETPVEEKDETSGGKGKTMEVQANRVAVDETAVVTEGMTITGDIVSEGSMELIGTVNGNLDILGKLNITGTIQGNSKAAEIYAEGAKISGEVNSLGSVKIGQSSVVIGNITATSAVVAGAVKGDIDVQGPVILDTTAIVMGNIKSKSVQINNGAVIEGMCSQCYADVNPTSFFEEFKKKK